MSRHSPPNVVRRSRRTESCQALVETALVTPLLMAVLLLFVGTVLLAEAVNEVRTATTVATVSAFSAPAGAPQQALAAVNDSFAQSINSGYISGRNITCPRADGNEFLYSGATGRGTYVSCHGQGKVDLSQTVVGIIWRWSVTVEQDAKVPVPQYLQCAQAVAPC